MLRNIFTLCTCGVSHWPYEDLQHTMGHNAHTTFAKSKSDSLCLLMAYKLPPPLVPEVPTESRVNDYLTHADDSDTEDACDSNMYCLSD